jgi:hypothetical protein
MGPPACKTLPGVRGSAWQTAGVPKYLDLGVHRRVELMNCFISSLIAVRPAGVVSAVAV